MDEPKSIGRNWTVVWTAVGSLGTVAAVIVAIIALDGGDNAASGGASETPQASLESSTSSSSPPESSSSSSSSPPPPPVPVEHTVPLKMLYDGSGTTTIGGQRFPYVAVGLHGAAVTVDDGTCTSLTLSAGIEDYYDASDVGTVTLQVQAGHSGGGSMPVKRGEITTQTFSMEPGAFAIAVESTGNVYMDGVLKCQTPSGRSE